MRGHPGLKIGKRGSIRTCPSGDKRGGGQCLWLPSRNLPFGPGGDRPPAVESRWISRREGGDSLCGWLRVVYKSPPAVPPRPARWFARPSRLFGGVPARFSTEDRACRTQAKIVVRSGAVKHGRCAMADR